MCQNRLAFLDFPGLLQCGARDPRRTIYVLLFGGWRPAVTTEKTSENPQILLGCPEETPREPPWRPHWSLTAHGGGIRHRPEGTV
eukprot:3496925-Pyramimonas_sp.AAC.1